MKWLLLITCSLFACKAKQERQTVFGTDTATVVNTLPQTDTTLLPFAQDSPPPVVEPPRMKRPTGIYQLLLSHEGLPAIEHTISFNGQNYRLQERYIKDQDSIVVTEGTWATSDGYIWLYRDQVAAGRYTWKGDQLQYYDPAEKKRYGMQKLLPVSNNKVFAEKGKQGVIFFGVGNEPFWNVQLEENDTLRFHLAEWPAPLKLKLRESKIENDGSLYFAGNDSATLKVLLLPYFCSDGMSDFTYDYQVRADFRGRIYTGCAIVYKNR